MKRDNSTFVAENISAKHLAIGPLDGRYAQIGEALAPYFSEFALVKYRVKVEIYWLKYLIENIAGNSGSSALDDFNSKLLPVIMSIYENFSDQDFVRVKEIEAQTNHDVKSVELFIAEQLEAKGHEHLGLRALKSFVHIGCTSEDITNCAYALMISSALKEVWQPKATELLNFVTKMAGKYADVPMLAHTHGQPATPTTVGKELAVYAYRFTQSLRRIVHVPITAKFNGATGNYAAISVAFPNNAWMFHSECFVVQYLGLTFNPVTTQIESHDNVCHLLDEIRHFNNVLRDFDTDMWLYISMEYFKQIPVKTEVGSSTMPHKVNPIRFENSEANIKIGNAICAALSDELPRSRMQRDLSDSSLQRNIGLAFGYSLQAIGQTIGGLKKVEVNKEKIESELNSNWAVLAEPIQTMLRKYGIPDAYDHLKELTRGKEITESDIKNFIKSLDVLSEKDQQILLKLTPASYIGDAIDIAKAAASVGY